jgi:hemolysin III
MEAREEVMEKIDRLLEVGGSAAAETACRECVLQGAEISDEDSASSGYVAVPGKRRKAKPYWRGKLHRIAFFATIGLFLVFLLFIKRINKIAVCVYFVSQLILYGVSSTYHMTDWKSPQMEAMFRRLDHSSIFVMISGTQTCVVFSLYQLYGSSRLSPVMFVPITYLLTVLGILKVFFLRAIPKYVTILYYIFHGCAATPFFTVHAFLRDKYIFLACLAGGAFYIMGSAIYGTRKPDPWPRKFGYHEVFHLFTIIANLCFMSTLVRASMFVGDKK